MRWGSGLVNLFYNVATGKSKTRIFLTPAGEVFYFGLIVLFITISFWIDKLFRFLKLLPGFLGVCVSIPVIAVGVFLMTWSVLCFFKARGTPVPFNPPPR
ncbi:hypothetical protein J7K97_00465 [Candidatus Aerophobetes bacterium]|nr:hypothetical protein [Candidatus Aerophobetes bacterium]